MKNKITVEVKGIHQKNNKFVNLWEYLFIVLNLDKIVNGCWEKSKWKF